MRPVVFLNFKSYPQAAGKKGLKLAQIALEVAKEYDVEIYIAPQLVDTSMLSYSGVPVFAQHCDPMVGNGGTGKIGVDTLEMIGAKGLLINHSEYPQTVGEILFLVGEAKRRGLKSLVCIPDEHLLYDLKDSTPDFLAVEPPELIGGNISVSAAKPELLTSVFEFVASSMRSTRRVCGAGIKSGEDVRKARVLGAEGVLVSSGFVLADDPKSALEDLATGFG
ncbi:MAG: triose-phosphate isomerase [Thermoprotei archaeon]